MRNPKYLVNIVYQTNYLTGYEFKLIDGATYSLPVYEGNYFVASMPELNIAATGSSYTESLNNLLAIATASNTYNSNPPINSIRTW